MMAITFFRLLAVAQFWGSVRCLFWHEAQFYGARLTPPGASRLDGLFVQQARDEGTDFFHGQTQIVDPLGR